MKTIHVIVRGRVQGVFFRDHTRRQALHYNLTGWVRNLADGSVEAMLCGDDQKLSAMLSWIHQGSPHARVDEVEVRETESAGPLPAFEVRY
jgi:acylphosphatase